MTLHLPDENAYRIHYRDNFSRRPLPFRVSSGFAPVYFDINRFDHAFYESTQRNGTKDMFSYARAERMDDVAVALSDASADRRAGWNKSQKRHEQTSCVTLCLGDFVVVVRLGITRAGTLRGKFVTCYVADNSIGKIKRAPLWSEAACIGQLRNRALRGR